MKTLVLILVMASCSASLWSQGTWMRVIGTQTVKQEVTATATTSDGGLIVLGQLVTSSGNDMFVARLDRDGSILWNKFFGGSYNDIASAVVVNAKDELTVIGYTSSLDDIFADKNVVDYDIFYLKLDQKGNLRDLRVIGGSKLDFSSDAVLTPDGGMIISGTSNSQDGPFAGLNPEGRERYYILKVDAAGNIVWLRLFQRGFGIADIVLDNKGDAIAVGVVRKDSTSQKSQDLDIIMIKIDDVGDTTNIVRYGTDLDEIALSLSLLPNGDYVIAGSVHNSLTEPLNFGHRDVLVTLLTASGEIRWTRELRGSKEDLGMGAVSTSDGHIMLVGESWSNDRDFVGLTGKYRDVFLAKYDRAGTLVWLRNYGGSSTDYNPTIEKAGSDGVYLVARSASRDGDMTGYGAPYPLNTSTKTFVMKLDNDGKYSRSTSVVDNSPDLVALSVSPLPVSSSATVSFSVATESIVRIELINALGQVIGLLYHETTQPGAHQVSMATSSLPTGAYTLRMTSNTGIATSSVMVVH